MHCSLPQGQEPAVGHPPLFAYVIRTTLSSLTRSEFVFCRNLEEVMVLNNFAKCPELVRVITGVRMLAGHNYSEKNWSHGKDTYLNLVQRMWRRQDAEGPDGVSGLLHRRRQRW